MISLAVSGARGKMGSHILLLAFQEGTFKVVGALEKEGHPELGKDIGELLGVGPKKILLSSEAEKALKGAQVLVEFSSPEATVAHLRAVKTLQKAMVIGTTGLTPEQHREVEEASRTVPVLLSPNMSVGVNLLFDLVSEATRRLGSDYEVEIVEAHHHHKKDSPSGTAKRLAELIASARKESLEKVARYGRKGLEESRPKNVIGIHSLRMGDVVGDHTVVFATSGERVELTHRASSRETFARGALRAARFLVGKKPGLYSLQDVLRADSSG